MRKTTGGEGEGGRTTMTLMNFDEREYANLVRLLNKHLPASRKTLAELLNEERPTLLGKDGLMHRIKREELLMLADMLTEEEQKRLKIPIYIELSPKHHGMARIQGKISCKIVREILGKERKIENEHRYDGWDLSNGFDRTRNEEESIFIHRADIRKLRRILKTTTQYVFMP